MFARLNEPSKESKGKLGPLSHAEKKKKLQLSEELYIFSDDRSNNSTLATHSHDLNKQPHAPQPPKGRQKPVLMDRVGTTQPEVEANPVNSQPLNCTGSEGLRFDDQGMVLPHSILGSLEDFRSYLEAQGETELVKRIPKSQRDALSEAPGRQGCQAVGNGCGLPSGHRNIQSNALQHWHTHITQRRRQQDFLCDLLDRPVENLLMNQADHFRETQERREFLNRVMPLIHSSYGYRVGSEFWSLPQRYGDEMSGITATLTQTERGRWEPITHVGQPRSIRQESGIICTETPRPASRTWEQSVYLERQCQEIRKVIRDMDIKKPDITGLEVIGSSKPFTFVTVCRSPFLEKEEQEKEQKRMNETLDPVAQYDDALLIPALRFCGQLARWTGNSTTNQGKVGISATIIFEALAGERASSNVGLHNEGSTAIFYSWQQRAVPSSFPNLRSQTKSPHFYFDSSSGVILPGDTKMVEFIFKSEEPGIKTELWQLNTHPVLLQGASMQMALRGVALYQDDTADQRLFIEAKLEKIVVLKLCQSIVYEVLQGVHTPERPRSPAELYITEEEEFLRRNPKLQYLDQPVEELKRLWQEGNPGGTWDLSVDTLRQVVLSSLSEQESAQEKSLAQLNSLLLQLSEPPELKHHFLRAEAIGQQLWKKLLDAMAGEATLLRNLLGLPHRDTWIDNKEQSQVSDADLADNKDEKSEKKGGAAAKEERNGGRARLKDDNKGESATTEKSTEESKKKGKRREEAGKRTREKHGKGLALQSDTSNSQKLLYTRLLHRKVYALMEDLVDNLCDLMDDLNVGEDQDTQLTPKR